MSHAAPMGMFGKRSEARERDTRTFRINRMMHKVVRGYDREGIEMHFWRREGAWDNPPDPRVPGTFKIRATLWPAGDEDDGPWSEVLIPCRHDGKGNVDYPIVQPRRPPAEEKRRKEEQLLAQARTMEATRKRREELAWAKRVVDGERSSQRAAIPRKVKLAVYERDGGACVECGSTTLLQYDHIIPLAKGGSNSIKNLQLLCDTCNQRKGSSL